MLIFNEDTRVKIPATIQYLKIGYNYQSLKDDRLDIDFNTKIFVSTSIQLFFLASLMDWYS